MKFVLKKFKREIDVKRLAHVHYFNFNESFNTRDDSHDFCELVYVDKGRINISSEFYTGELIEGCMILHTASEVHSLTCMENIAPSVIIIGFECESPELSVLSHTPLLLDDDMQKSLAEIIKEARSVYLPPYDVPNQSEMKKRQSFSFGADQIIRDYLQIFLIRAVRALKDRDLSRAANESLDFPRIWEVKKYLDENFSERIGIEELCFIFNTNRSTLSKSFKKAYSKTVMEYVTELRIEYTKNMLSRGASLTKISENLNLSSVHYLTALFKQHTGMSPTEYINLRKSN